jgi:sensor c-di-GMP phosphodiesterase-like protein
MKKAVRTVLAYVIGLTLVACPVLVSMDIAKRLSVHFQSQKAMSLADEIMRRTEETGHQAQVAVQTLAAHKAGPACSSAEIALMRQLAISASNLQSVGRIEGTRLICSSLGNHGAGLELGPPDYISHLGTSVHIAARLALAPQSTFIIAESHGYAAIIHQNLVLDLPEYSANTALAMVDSNTGRIVVARGSVDPAWMRTLAKGEARVFAERGFITALRRAKSFDLTAVVAISPQAVALNSRELMFVLAPIGLLLGLALAWACRWLVRHQESIPVLLRAALRREEFFLAYQPIVHLDTGQCVGAEALLRWRRRDGTLVSPDIFIPIAEDSGIISSITQRVLALVERDVPTMVAAFPQLRIGVNLPSDDLQSDHIVQQLGDLMRRSGIQPGNLVIEATERGFIGTERAAGIIQDIRSAGISVAVDDFGTGYSCLSYLTTLDFNFLKIDRSFIATIGTDDGADSVLLHIIELGKSLNLGLVAEGVETEAQAEFLLGHGVQYAQGWLFAKPMSAEDYMVYLNAKAVAKCIIPFAALRPEVGSADQADVQALESVT